MQKSFWERLTDKTFISFIASYLVAGWGIIQFLDWFTRRYGYSRGWTDSILLFLVLLLPGVIAFAWQRANSRSKHRRGAIILSTNALLAVLLTFVGFRNQLFANTSTITVTNEEGKEIKRSVPVQASTRRIVFFPFRISGAGAEKWESVGWPTIQALDLEQDNRIFATTPLGMIDDLAGYKYDLFSEIPFSIQRKIAQDRLADYWVTCTVSDSLRFQVFSARDASPFFSKSYYKTDYFTEIDAFSNDFFSSLFNREVAGARQEYVDLPATDLLSNNPEALGFFFRGAFAGDLENNYPKCNELLAKAIAADPNFATAHAEMGKALYFSGKAQEAVESYENALEMLAPLPERQQLDIKSRYYITKQDVNRATLLLEMWRKLYPKDYRPYNRLFKFYQLTGRLDQALDIGKLALENDHAGPMLLNLARLNFNRGHFEEAADYLNRYQEAHPEKAANTKEIGELYLKQGKIAEALDFYEELTILNPDDHQALKSLAEAQIADGKFRKAAGTVREALRNANTVKDSIEIYKTREVIFEKQGQLASTIEQMQKRWDLMRTVYPEIAITTDLMMPQNVQRFDAVGRAEEIRELLLQGVQLLKNDQVDIECVLFVNFDLAVEDGESLQKRLDNCMDDIIGTSGEVLVPYLEGFSEKFRGNYPAAITKFKIFIDSAGIANSVQGKLILADCYRRSEQSAQALSLFEDVLRVSPNDATVLYLYADVLQKNKRSAEAKQSLEKALEIWSEADDNYELMLDARSLLASISSQ